MARIRQIKPQFFVDEDLSKVSALARLMFIGLWTIADRDGRLEDKPKTIKLQTIPFDEADPSAVLDELQAACVLVRYVNGGKKYIQIKAFARHQKPHRLEPKSELPAPDAKKRDQTGSVAIKPDADGSCSADSGILVLGSGEDPTPSDRPRPRTDYQLTTLFTALWEKRYGRRWLGKAMSAAAVSKFMDREPDDLDALAPLVRPALEHFLADDRPYYLERGHALEIFVKDFDAHSGPAPPKRTAPPLRALPPSQGDQRR